MSGHSEFDRYARDYTELHRASIAASGEEPAYFARYKADYAARAVGPRLAAQRLALLDFGCGVGNAIPHLRAAFPQAKLYGVDPSAASIDIAHASHAADATFRTGAEDAIPFPDAEFDLVHVACVFHHIEPPRRAHWMRELRRVTKPGGALFVFEHNVLNPLTRKAVRDCPFDADAVLLPRQELLDLVRGAGFARVRARYIVFFPAVLAALRPLEPFLGHVPFGAQYVVRATA